MEELALVDLWEDEPTGEAIAVPSDGSYIYDDYDNYMAACAAYYREEGAATAEAIEQHRLDKEAKVYVQLMASADRDKVRREKKNRKRRSAEWQAAIELRATFKRKHSRPAPPRIE